MSFVFDSSIKEPEGFNRPAWWYVFQKHRLVVRPHESKEPFNYIPLKALDIRDELPDVSRVHFLGELGGEPCYVGMLPEAEPLNNGLEAISLRRLFGQMGNAHLRLAGRAIQILDWDRNHQFCGRCANPTELTVDDRSRVCPECGLRAYPRLSPAVIMAVIKKDRLLLARSSRHPQGFYSVLAGFVEPGETLEEAVAREVFEEVGLRVKKIRYYGSQPWPFPDSLMIGFVCEYENGEIELTDSEISEADWYKAGEIPETRPPAAISIAGQLIDWFIEANQ